MPINLQNQDLVEFVYQTPNSTPSSNYSDGSIVFHTDGNYTKIKLPGSVQTSDNFSIGDSENKEITITIEVSFIDRSEATYDEQVGGVSTDQLYTLADYINDCSSYPDVGPLVYLSDSFGSFIHKYSDSSEFYTQYHRFNITQDTSSSNTFDIHTTLSDMTREYIYIEDINGFTKTIYRISEIAGSPISSDMYYKVIYTFTGDLSYKLHISTKSLKYEGVKACLGQTYIQSDLSGGGELDYLLPVLSIPDRRYTDLEYGVWIASATISDVSSNSITAYLPIHTYESGLNGDTYEILETSQSWTTVNSTLVCNLNKNVTDVHLNDYVLSEHISNVVVGTKIYDAQDNISINPVTLTDSSYSESPYDIYYFNRSPFEVTKLININYVCLAVPDSYQPDGSAASTPQGKYTYCINCSLMNIIHCKHQQLEDFNVGPNVIKSSNEFDHQVITRSMLSNIYMIDPYYGESDQLTSRADYRATGVSVVRTYVIGKVFVVLAANSCISGSSISTEAQTSYLENSQRSSSLFFTCSSLKYVLFDGLDFSFVVRTMSMFSGCTSLEYIAFCYTSTLFIEENPNCVSFDVADTPYINLNQVRTISSMFFNDNSLIEIDFGTSINWFRIYASCSFDKVTHSAVNSMVLCFYNCSALTTIYTDESAVGFKDRIDPDIEDEYLSQLTIGNMPSIVGGAGTTWTKDSMEYARIDAQEPGYFTWYRTK